MFVLYLVVVVVVVLFKTNFKKLTMSQSPGDSFHDRDTVLQRDGHGHGDVAALVSTPE